MAVVEPGKWYLKVTCRNPECGRGLAYSEAPPPPTPVEIPSIIQIRCHSCGQVGVWTPDEVERAQGQKMN